MSQTHLLVHRSEARQSIWRSAVPELYKNPMLLWPRGLLRARSRFPETVEKIRNAKQRMEGLERRLVLAKQVLSQLSYTPTVGTTFILKHFRGIQNPFLRFSTITVPKLYQNPRLQGLLGPRQGSFRWLGG